RPELRRRNRRQAAARGRHRRPGPGPGGRPGRSARGAGARAGPPPARGGGLFLRDRPAGPAWLDRLRRPAGVRRAERQRPRGPVITRGPARLVARAHGAGARRPRPAPGCAAGSRSFPSRDGAVSARRGPSTTAVHGPPHRRPHWSPVAPPLIQSTTFVNPIGSDEPILYAGYGNTPTQVALAKKYAALEGAEDAVFVASGMAATALAHLAVLRPGDHLVASRWIYGGTQRLFDEELARFGITVTYVSPDEPRQWRKSVRRETRAVFVESPTNPLMRVVDLVPVLKIVKEFGVALLV